MTVADSKLRQDELTDEPIYFEFYEIAKIPFDTVTLKLIPLQEIKQKMDSQAILNLVLRDLQYYEVNCYNQIYEEKLELKFNKVWEFAIEKNQNKYGQINRKIITFNEQNPYYNVLTALRICQRFYSQMNFSYKIGNLIEWRINSRSFFKVIVGNIIKLAQKSKSKIIKEQNLSVWNLASSFLLNSILQIILAILFENLEGYEHLLEEVSYISIEFNEVPKGSKIISDEFIADDYLYFWEKIFRYTETDYYIYKSVLTIKLNIYIVHDSFDEIQNPLSQISKQTEMLVENATIKNYIYLITNKYDFYTKMLKMDWIWKIVKKGELSEQMSQLSRQISEDMSKTITLSLDYDSLYKMMHDMINKIQKNQSRFFQLSEKEKLWTKLSKFSRHILVNYKNQILLELGNKQFDEFFLVIYS
eukprot:TRINITY_DN15277_c0_g1_i2.p1 TRINITY_DN15277_c0_g1~~TRINITY_DN15277_c0_g1_i2.p1  ORF type:complete len:417 (+),score=65.72 TRINITY_DN15277_c0_g1_i2:1024-2274(+)